MIKQLVWLLGQLVIVCAALTPTAIAVILYLLIAPTTVTERMIVVAALCFMFGAAQFAVALLAFSVSLVWFGITRD